jgi:hypothetical protein
MGRRGSSPVLITNAAVSPADDFALRRRRYSLIMSTRILCLVVAGVFAIGFGWTTAAAVFAVLVVPLPWVAVLVANGSSRRRTEAVARRPEDELLGARGTRGLEPVQVVDIPRDRAA